MSPNRTPLLSLLLAGAALSPLGAQDATPPRPYTVGNPVGLPVAPAADGVFKPASSNVKMFGAVYSAESCTYDAERGVIVIPNRGVPQSVEANNAWISLLHHDGSVHTPRWIGIQSPAAQRDALTPPLRLNEPYGSDLVNGVLYLADRDGGTNANDPIISVVRRFNMKTGAPLPDIRVADAGWFNDIAVAADGTIYGSVTGTNQVWRVMPDGQASLFLQGELMNRPNGVAIDNQGQIVVVNVGNDAVLTFSRDGKLVGTEHTVQAGNDGIVIMPDGTKYISSVINGGISRIRPGQAAELIAENIPSAASMCYDSGARQLVIPMNANNGIALVKLP
jgi:sugar lactone lactonase YvrE